MHSELCRPPGIEPGLEAITGPDGPGSFCVALRADLIANSRDEEADWRRVKYSLTAMVVAAISW